MAPGTEPKSGGKDLQFVQLLMMDGIDTKSCMRIHKSTRTEPTHLVRRERDNGWQGPYLNASLRLGQDHAKAHLAAHHMLIRIGRAESFRCISIGRLGVSPLAEQVVIEPCQAYACVVIRTGSTQLLQRVVEVE
jgi:hypothetical protein